jgi:hypothetical protein
MPSRFVFSKQSVRLLSALVLLALASSPALQAAQKSGSGKGTSHAAAESEKPKATAPAAAEKKTETKAETKTEPSLENAVAVSPEDLVSKPQEWLGKNVKFTANFFAWSNLALDYKPAFRSSKTHLSFLILKPGSHIPLSELKLAMMIPKDKDPEAALFATLKDGDQVELTGKVFSSALDDPWMEVFKLKKLSSSKDDKDKTAQAEGKEKSAESGKEADAKTGGEKSEGASKEEKPEAK